MNRPRVRASVAGGTPCGGQTDSISWFGAAAPLSREDARSSRSDSVAGWPPAGLCQLSSFVSGRGCKARRYRGLSWFMLDTQCPPDEGTPVARRRGKTIEDRAKQVRATGARLSAAKQALRDSLIVQRKAQNWPLEAIAAEAKVTVRTVSRVLEQREAVGEALLDRDPIDVVKQMAAQFEASIGDFEAMAYAYGETHPLGRRRGKEGRRPGPREAHHAPTGHRADAPGPRRARGPHGHEGAGERDGGRRPGLQARRGRRRPRRGDVHARAWARALLASAREAHDVAVDPRRTERSMFSRRVPAAPRLQRTSSHARSKTSLPRTLL